jgi:hypothetical protein
MLRKKEDKSFILATCDIVDRLCNDIKPHLQDDCSFFTMTDRMIKPTLASDGIFCVSYSTS